MTPPKKLRKTYKRKINSPVLNSRSYIPDESKPSRKYASIADFDLKNLPLLNSEKLTKLTAQATNTTEEEVDAVIHFAFHSLAYWLENPHRYGGYYIPSFMSFNIAPRIYHQSKAWIRMAREHKKQTGKIPEYIKRMIRFNRQQHSVFIDYNKKTKDLGRRRKGDVIQMRKEGKFKLSKEQYQKYVDNERELFRQQGLTEEEIDKKLKMYNKWATKNKQLEQFQEELRNGKQ